MDPGPLRRRALADPEDLALQAEALRERLRSGELPEARARAAARCGHAAARSLFPEERRPVRERRPGAELLSELEAQRLGIRRERPAPRARPDPGWRARVNALLTLAVLILPFVIALLMDWRKLGIQLGLIAGPLALGIWASERIADRDPRPDRWRRPRRLGWAIAPLLVWMGLFAVGYGPFEAGLLLIAPGLFWLLPLVLIEQAFRESEQHARERERLGEVLLRRSDELA